MGKRIKTFLVLMVIMLMLPLVITMIFQKNALLQEGKNGESIYPENSSEVATETERKSTTEDLEGKVVAILAKEISVNSEKEAIKAQAVIARTNLVGAKLSHGKEPEGLTTDQMMKLFGASGFNGCYKKLSECVQETAGLVMVSNKKIIEAPYFAVSAGATRSAKDAIGKDDVAYLQREDSAQDITSPDFLKVEFWKLEDFVNQCNKAYPDAKLTTQDLMKQIEITARDDSEYVNQIKLGNTTVSGEELRNTLNLNSACFTIKEVDEQVRIVTKGLGHGVGLSQYGANSIAQDGKDFKEILKKYYSGIQITYAE